MAYALETSQIPVAKGKSKGVRALRLQNEDSVLGMGLMDQSDLVIENSQGEFKRIALDQINAYNRPSKGDTLIPNHQIQTRIRGSFPDRFRIRLFCALKACRANPLRFVCLPASRSLPAGRLRLSSMSQNRLSVPIENSKAGLAKMKKILQTRNRSFLSSTSVE